MKKVITISCTVGAVFIILLSVGFFNALMMFLLVGVIPGTNYIIPPHTMLLIISGFVALLLVRLTAIDVYYAVVHKRITKQVVQHKKRMPKRRFGQV